MGFVPYAPAGARDAGLDALTPTSQPAGLARSDGEPSPPTLPPSVAFSGASTQGESRESPLSAFRCLFVESREPRSGAFTEGGSRVSGAST